MKRLKQIVVLVFVFMVGYCAGTESEHAEAVRRYRHYEQQIEKLTKAENELP